jgi:hypothetical protein
VNDEVRRVNDDGGDGDGDGDGDNDVTGDNSTLPSIVSDDDIELRLDDDRVGVEEDRDSEEDERATTGASNDKSIK